MPGDAGVPSLTHTVEAGLGLEGQDWPTPRERKKGGWWRTEETVEDMVKDTSAMLRAHGHVCLVAASPEYMLAVLGDAVFEVSDNIPHPCVAVPLGGSERRLAAASRSGLWCVVDGSAGVIYAKCGSGGVQGVHLLDTPACEASDVVVGVGITNLVVSVVLARGAGHDRVRVVVLHIPILDGTLDSSAAEATEEVVLMESPLSPLDPKGVVGGRHQALLLSFKERQVVRAMHGAFSPDSECVAGLWSDGTVRCYVVRRGRQQGPVPVRMLSHFGMDDEEHHAEEVFSVAPRDLNGARPADFSWVTHLYGLPSLAVVTETGQLCLFGNTCGAFSPSLTVTVGDDPTASYFLPLSALCDEDIVVGVLSPSESEGGLGAAKMTFEAMNVRRNEPHATIEKMVSLGNTSEACRVAAQAGIPESEVWRVAWERSTQGASAVDTIFTKLAPSEALRACCASIPSNTAFFTRILMLRLLSAPVASALLLQCLAASVIVGTPSEEPQSRRLSLPADRAVIKAARLFYNNLMRLAGLDKGIAFNDGEWDIAGPLTKGLCDILATSSASNETSVIRSILSTAIIESAPFAELCLCGLRYLPLTLPVERLRTLLPSSLRGMLTSVYTAALADPRSSSPSGKGGLREVELTVRKRGDLCVPPDDTARLRQALLDRMLKIAHSGVVSVAEGYVTQLALDVPDELGCALEDVATIIHSPHAMEVRKLVFRGGLPAIEALQQLSPMIRLAALHVASDGKSSRPELLKAAKLTPSSLRALEKLCFEMMDAHQPLDCLPVPEPTLRNVLRNVVRRQKYVRENDEHQEAAAGRGASLNIMGRMISKTRDVHAKMMEDVGLKVSKDTPVLVSQVRKAFISPVLANLPSHVFTFPENLQRRGFDTLLLEALLLEGRPKAALALATELSQVSQDEADAVGRALVAAAHEALKGTADLGLARCRDCVDAWDMLLQQGYLDTAHHGSSSIDSIRNQLDTLCELFGRFPAAQEFVALGHEIEASAIPKILESCDTVSADDIPSLITPLRRLGLSAELCMRGVIEHCIATRNAPVAVRACSLLFKGVDADVATELISRVLDAFGESLKDDDSSALCSLVASVAPLRDCDTWIAKWSQRAGGRKVEGSVKIAECLSLVVSMAAASSTAQGREQVEQDRVLQGLCDDESASRECIRRFESTARAVLRTQHIEVADRLAIATQCTCGAVSLFEETLRTVVVVQERCELAEITAQCPLLLFGASQGAARRAIERDRDEEVRLLLVEHREALQDALRAAMEAVEVDELQARLAVEGEEEEGWKLLIEEGDATKDEYHRWLAEVRRLEAKERVSRRRIHLTEELSRCRHGVDHESKAEMLLLAAQCSADDVVVKEVAEPEGMARRGLHHDETAARLAMVPQLETALRRAVLADIKLMYRVVPTMKSESLERAVLLQSEREEWEQVCFAANEGCRLAALAEVDTMEGVQRAVVHGEHVETVVALWEEWDCGLARVRTMEMERRQRQKVADAEGAARRALQHHSVIEHTEREEAASRMEIEALEDRDFARMEIRAEADEEKMWRLLEVLGSRIMDEEIAREEVVADWLAAWHKMKVAWDELAHREHITAEYRRGTAQLRSAMRGLLSVTMLTAEHQIRYEIAKAESNTRKRLEGDIGVEMTMVGIRLTKSKWTYDVAVGVGPPPRIALSSAVHTDGPPHSNGWDEWVSSDDDPVTKQPASGWDDEWGDESESTGATPPPPPPRTPPTVTSSPSAAGVPPKASEAAKGGGTASGWDDQWDDESESTGAILPPRTPPPETTSPAVEAPKATEPTGGGGTGWEDPWDSESSLDGLDAGKAESSPHPSTPPPGYHPVESTLLDKERGPDEIVYQPTDQPTDQQPADQPTDQQPTGQQPTDQPTGQGATVSGWDEQWEDDSEVHPESAQSAKDSNAKDGTVNRQPAEGSGWDEPWGDESTDEHQPADPPLPTEGSGPPPPPQPPQPPQPSEEVQGRELDSPTPAEGRGAVGSGWDEPWGEESSDDHADPDRPSDPPCAPSRDEVVTDSVTAEVADETRGEVRGEVVITDERANKLSCTPDTDERGNGEESHTREGGGHQVDQSLPKRSEGEHSEDSIEVPCALPKAACERGHESGRSEDHGWLWEAWGCHSHSPSAETFHYAAQRLVDSKHIVDVYQLHASKWAGGPPQMPVRLTLLAAAVASAIDLEEPGMAEALHAACKWVACEVAPLPPAMSSDTTCLLHSLHRYLSAVCADLSEQRQHAGRDAAHIAAAVALLENGAEAVRDIIDGPMRQLQY